MRLELSKTSTTDDMIEISSSDEEEACQPHYWLQIHGIELYQADKDLLLNGQWLTDKIIHATQLLLKNDSTLLPVGSLQDPILGQTLAFDIASEESVQILHSGGNHWVTISTVGTKHPNVYVYDSLYRELPFTTCEQVAALLQTDRKVIQLQFRNIQVGSTKSMLNV